MANDSLYNREVKMTDVNGNNKSNIEGIIINGNNGSYKLEKLLYTGGNTSISTGTSVSNGKEVVIKEYKLGLSQIMSFDQREKLEKSFLEEVDVLRQINDDGIPKLVDIVRIEDSIGRENPCIVMEYFKGESIKDLIDRNINLPESKVVDLLYQAVRIVDKIQNSGARTRVIRDLKPEHLIVRENNKIGIIDFGSSTSDIERTFGQTIGLGTPGYTAPEVWRAKAVPSSDIYQGDLNFIFGTSKVGYGTVISTNRFRD